VSNGAYVYAVGEKWGGAIKIGVAADVDSRVRALQSGNPAVLQVLWKTGPRTDAFKLETFLHRHLSPLQIRGEWFLVNGPEALAEALSRFVSAPSDLPVDESVDAASLAVSVLLDRIVRIRQVTALEAFSVLSAEQGVRRQIAWRLKYRKPKDIFASDYQVVSNALFSACGAKPERMPEPARLRAVAQALDAAGVAAALPIALPTAPIVPFVSVERLQELDRLIERLQADREPAVAALIGDLEKFSARAKRAEGSQLSPFDPADEDQSDHWET
jgi:hypothetical protein